MMKKNGVFKTLFVLLLVVLGYTNMLAQGTVAGDAAPYAVLSENTNGDLVLTFYCDDQKTAKNGMDIGPFTWSYDENQQRYNISSGWDEQRENITNIVFDASFANCTTLTSTAFWFFRCNHLTEITGINNLKTDNVTDMRGMFYGCSGLTSLDVSNFKTDNVADMYEMFYGCSSLTSLDVSGFKTDKVTNMGNMFSGCSGLTNLDVSGFKTDKVMSMGGMFFDCSGLTSLDVSNFKTDNVTMSHMFHGCSKLINLDVSGFETDNVTDMAGMFSGCSSLTSLDVSNFKTDNVTDMGMMFSYCSSLTSLNLSSFNTSNVKYDTNNYSFGIQSMFQGCSALTTIWVSDNWTTANLTESADVFTGCAALVGGAGTHYDPDHVDYTYARIDGGPNSQTPGYFTEKNAPVTLEAPTITVNDEVLTITTNTGDVKIYYTLDGSKPTTESTEYTGPVTLTQNCSVRAIVAKEGMDSSEESVQEVGGLTKSLLIPTPVISHEENLFTITVPSVSGTAEDETDKVAVEPASWGGNAPKVDLSGEWTCNVLNNNNEITDTYGVTLNEDGSAVFPSPCLAESSWYYNNGQLVMRHDKHYTYNPQYSYQYAEYNLTPVTPDNPIEFTGIRNNIVGNDITESVSPQNVIFTYNGTSLPMETVTTEDNRETVVAVADEGNSDKTGILLMQNVTDLTNGYYTVELYAKSIYSTAEAMATDVTYLFANEEKLFIPLEADKKIQEHNVYLLNVEVTDGTLHIGLGKEKTGANWHALQIRMLKRHTLTTDQSMPGTSIYYSTNGVDPTTASIGYTNPFQVTENCTIKAIAMAEGYSNSGIASFVVDWFASNPEPYAVLSDNNTVLTFYYDMEREQRNGMSVGPFLSYSERGWNDQCGSITNVVFDASFAECTTLTSTAHWFYGCENLTSITDISNLRTDNVTRMRYMFRYCSNLTSLDVSGFKTDNVTDMLAMFSYCSNLTSLDVSGFNTENVTDMMDMFDRCSKLTTIDVSHFNTEKVTNMSVMFQLCTSLTSLDLTNFNTSNVTNTQGMFYGCSNLVNLDIGSFDMSKVNNEEKNMFVDCSSLASIIAGFAEIPAEEYAKIANPNLLVYVNEARLAPEGVQNVVVNGVAKEIVLKDAEGNNNWYCPEPFRAEKISYTRDFRQQTQIGVSRGWESLALPFAVQTITHQDKGVIAPFGSDASGLHFWLRRLGREGLTSVQMIEPNTPYIISMPNSEEYPERFNLSGLVTFAAEDAFVERTEQMVDESADYMMVPAFQRMAVSEDVYALNVGEEHNGRPEGSIFERNYREVRPFEAFTVHRGDQPAPQFFSLSDLEAATTNVQNHELLELYELSGDEWFTLDGRKLQKAPTAKGVYIRNGRKTVVH